MIGNKNSAGDKASYTVRKGEAGGTAKNNVASRAEQAAPLDSINKPSEVNSKSAEQSEAWPKSIEGTTLKCMDRGSQTGSREGREMSRIVKPSCGEWG